MQNHFFTSIVIAFVLLSCKAQQTSVSPSQGEPVTVITTLDSNKWYLTKIHQQEDVITVTTRKAFIRFNEAKGSAGGNGSCNSFGSALLVKGNMISFSNIFSTKMYCDQVQEVENAFLGQLSKVTRYDVKGKSLLLYNGEKLLLEFEE
jgi:heat shock protein HslJ